MYVGIGNAFLYLGIPRFTKDKSIITPKEKSWGCRPKTLACQAHNPLASGPAAIIIYLFAANLHSLPARRSQKRSRRAATRQRRRYQEWHWPIPVSSFGWRRCSLYLGLVMRSAPFGPHKEDISTFTHHQEDQAPPQATAAKMEHQMM